MPKFIDKTGTRFGRLVAQRATRPGNGGRVKWWCSCDCGNELWVSSSDLGGGHTQSCGCLQRERTSESNSTHRYALPGRVRKTYLSWQKAKARCQNPLDKRYAEYGGRGISMCAKWSESFEAFLDDMGDAPEGKSLDRWPDTNGNYEPGNCRWATPKEQADNRRRTIWVGTPSGDLTLKDFAANEGVEYKALHYQVRSRGKSPQDAVTYLRSR